MKYFYLLLFFIPFVRANAIKQKSKAKMISHVLEKLMETSNGQCVSYFVENDSTRFSSGDFSLPVIVINDMDTMYKSKLIFQILVHLSIFI